MRSVWATGRKQLLVNALRRLGGFGGRLGPPRPTKARLRGACGVRIHSKPMQFAFWLAALAPLPPLQDQALEREWATRRWACAPTDHAPAIRAALASPDWQERHAAADALRRAALAGVAGARALAPEARAHLGDPQRNVRAELLAALAAAGDPADPPEALFADGDPLVRLELARFEVVRGAALGELLHDPRGAVRELAARGLASAGPDAARAQFAFLAPADPPSALPRVHAGRLAGATPLLLAGGVAPDLIGWLRLAAAREERAGTQALVEALALRSGGGAPVGVAGLRAPVDRQTLVRGWLAFEPPAGAQEPDALELADRRRQLLAACARDGDSRLADLLLEACLDLAPWAQRWRRAGLAVARSLLFLSARTGAPTGSLALAFTRWSAAAGPSVEGEGERAGEPRFPRHRADALRWFRQPFGALAFLLECAGDALDGARVAEGAFDLDPALAAILWDRARPPEGAWPDAVARWLAPSRPRDSRFAVARALSIPLMQRGEASSRRHLAALLASAQRDLVEAVFRWMVEDPEPDLEALHAAWRRAPQAERLELLQVLSRARPQARFRDDLLELVRRDADRTASVLELLAAFEGDGGVRAALAGALEQELDQLAAGLAPDAFRAHEWHAVGLVRALHAVAGEEAVAAVDGALDRALRAAPEPRADAYSAELPKACASLLARTAPGRARLASRLGPEVPRRVRVEAAIGLAAGGGPEVEGVDEVLARDYAGCDAPLRGRILAALGARPGELARAFLERVASDPGADLDQRVAALGSLGSLGATAALARVLDGARDSDVQREAVTALARVGTSEARAVLLGRLEPRLDAWSRDAFAIEHEALLAGELFVALARAGALPEAWRERAFARPLRAAPGDMAARFRGERLPQPEFTWDAELRLAEVLAARGELGAALAGPGAAGAAGAAGDWRRMDARLLLALGERALAAAFDPSSASAAGEPPAERVALARALFEAGRIGLEGEALAGDAGRESARAALRLAFLAETSRRFEDLAGHHARLFTALRLEPSWTRALESELGAFDRRAGCDPGARLRSARLQALARAALVAGDGARAKALARRARAALGASRAAALAQERLEADLERAE